MRRRLAFAAALAFVLGCARQIRREPADDLDGFKASISNGAEASLSVDGSVEDVPAEVILDLALPLSTVTTGCFLRSGVPTSSKTVRVPQPNGTLIEVAEIVLPPARIGNRKIGTRLGGLLAGDRKCVLSLGSDVLSSYALQFLPTRREIGLVHSRPRQQYLDLTVGSREQTDEVRVLDLERHPSSDWPLLSARARQGSSTLTSAFVLSTRDRWSTLSELEASSSGFRSQSDLADKFSIDRPRSRLHKLASFAVDELELSPGFGIKYLLLPASPVWKNRAAAGVLGGDVWGRFEATFDLQAGVLVLRRPRIAAAGTRRLCQSGENGQLSEEACFVLHTVKLGDSLSTVGTVWRELPEGARLYLDPVDAEGRPLPGECRFGLSFTRADRGSSMRRAFPWQALERSMPDCAALVRRASSFSLALFDEGSLQECTGQCAFVRRSGSRKVVCHCAITADSEASSYGMIAVPPGSE